MLKLEAVQEARVRADAAVWNALIATAGRAGQLQRAFQALEDMQVCSLAVVDWVQLYCNCHSCYNLLPYEFPIRCCASILSWLSLVPCNDATM